MKSNYLSTAVILTAVEVETASIKKVFGQWSTINVEGDQQTYYETAATNTAGTEMRIITAQQKVMGMTACTMLACKAINLFRPKYLIMSGIAAGTSESFTHMYGDVIVPDITWDYTTGKYVGPDESEIRFGDIGFLPRPISIKTDSGVLEKVYAAQKSPDNEFQVHVGPMACGSCVVANEEVVERQIKALFPSTIGIDMESYSVCFAAENASDPKPLAIVAKSICDYANSEKDDRFQKFAAFNSASFINYLLINHLDV